MRADAIGMFWEDVAQSGRGKKAIRAMPPIPDTGWRPPAYFPDLSSAPYLSIDTETKDEELLEKGPGWARGKGHIVGVSIGAPGGKWYFPIRHEVEAHDNLDPEIVKRWLQHTLGNPKQPKVGANIMYDVGWLAWEGIDVKGELIDVQYAEALLDERAKVGLEVLAQKYLGEGKQGNLLYQWCSDYYGGKPNDAQRANIWRAPPRLVGHYAESDADLPLRLAPILYALMQKEGLIDVFRMECGLIPLLIKMRLAGVRVDLEKAEETRGLLKGREEEAILKLQHLAGYRIDAGTTGTTLAKAFDRLGLAYPRTAPSKLHPTGQPSFTKSFLETVDNPLAEGIREIRRLNKLRTTFIESYILDNHINGMVYGQFHPMRGDDGGTRSGRFSSSTPNLQNIPIRDPELAKIIRGMYVPDLGHLFWRKYDYSQIEYRFLIHFAVGPGSAEVRELFNRNPDTDYHELTLDMVAPHAGWDVSTKELRKQWRRPIKNINFGLIYGMGVPKLARSLGMGAKEGKTLFQHYHRAVPFAKSTADATSKEAQSLGIITTIMGRRSRFDLWSEADSYDSDSPALSLDAALMKWGRIERAYTHKALNRRLQGSAADLMKLAMKQCWDDGIFDATGVPRLTVHDELDFSDPGGRDEAFREMKRVMETCMKLRVPVRADGDIGPNWGDVQPIPA
jgi:DNA polymerase I-like protein with 3'-5' exonuclease and polymerase domains